MPHGSDEVIFIGIILGIALFILLILFLGIFAIVISEHGRKEKITFPLLVKMFTGLVTTPKADPKIETSLLSPASEVIIPALDDGQKNTFKINQRAINLLGVPITLALMMGLIFVLVLLNPTDKVYFDMALEPWLWSILRIFVGIGGGGAIGIRIAHLSWRQTVLTALLTGACAMLISRFEISPFYSSLRVDLEGNFQFNMFLLGSLAVSAPVFLLPLCDPLLRQNGLAPSRQKVLSVAFFISLMFFQLAQIAVAVFLMFTGLLLGIGVILSLYRPMDSIGAEFGGLGLMLVLTSSFVWLSYISGSFN